MIDFFADPVHTPDPTPPTPYWARRNIDGYYTWRGIQYPSVTTILATAPGQHLMSWHGKKAAMKAASHLIQAGIELPKGDEALAEFCEGLVDRSLSIEEAHAEILAWATVMREAERYRDHKGRIGSITHHAMYEFVLRGGGRPRQSVEDDCRRIALELDLFGDAMRPTTAMLTSLATSAVPYVLSIYEWLEQADPEWEMIGQEAVVVHETTYDETSGESNEDGYAGTTDGIFTLHYERYSRHYDWPWLDRRSIQVQPDLKTSNSLAKSFQAQVVAYRMADFIGLVKDGAEFDIPPSEAIGVLHCGPHREFAHIRDEFGILASKTKAVGTKLLTWDVDAVTYKAFIGLCQWFHFLGETPRPHQRKPRAPKQERPLKTDPRPAPWNKGL